MRKGRKLRIIVNLAGQMSEDSETERESKRDIERDRKKCDWNLDI